MKIKSEMFTKKLLSAHKVSDSEKQLQEVQAALTQCIKDTDTFLSSQAPNIANSQEKALKTLADLSKQIKDTMKK